MINKAEQCVRYVDMSGERRCLCAVVSDRFFLALAAATLMLSLQCGHVTMQRASVTPSGLPGTCWRKGSPTSQRDHDARCVIPAGRWGLIC